MMSTLGTAAPAVALPAWWRREPADALTPLSRAVSASTATMTASHGQQAKPQFFRVTKWEG